MATPTTEPARPSAYGVAIGERVARYEIVGRLGAGGMGLVFVAHDPQLDRRVALKVIRRELDSEEARSRLTREAQSMAKLSHPNVVAVFDAGVFESEGGAPRVFIAMELIEGRDLREWVEALQKTEAWRRGGAVDAILEVYLAAGEGLAVAHEAGLVHRDFKPANVLIDDAGAVRVGDFGLARPVSERQVEAAAEGLADAEVDLDLDLTRTQDMIGTPGYMAPELYWPKPADARSDQYAFCVSLYESLYGERPVPGDSFGALVLATVQGRFRDPPEEPPVPAALRQILLRGLRVDPDERFEDMRALLDALRRERDRPRRRRRALSIGAAAIAAVGLAYGVGAFAGVEAPACASADASARALWSSERRAETGAAMRSVDAPFAASSAEAALEGLDGYAAGLAEGYRAACEATHVAHTQSTDRLDERSACLDRRALAFEMLLRELDTADRAVLERASAAVATLPSVDTCEAAGAGAEPVVPPALEASVSAARRRLESARAKLRAGRVEPALEEASEARADAEAIAWEPLSREARLVEGAALRARGRFGPAATALREVAIAALRARHDEQLVESATALVDVEGVRLAYPRAGEVWAELAQAALDRGPPRVDAQARLASERARLASARGERDAALRFARDAVRLVEATSGPDSLALAAPLAQLGDTLAKLRDHHGALEPLERLDALLASHLDETHPTRIAAAVRVAGAMLYARSAEEARPLIADARARAVANLPPDHPVLALALTRSGDALAMTGRSAEALPEYERALEATRAAYGDEHTEVARVLLNLAGAHARLGQTDEALRVWGDALEMRERLLGPSHPDLAIVLQNMGSVEVERGRAAEALEGLARAHRIRHEQRSSPQARADIDYWYGRALYESGATARGRPMVERAHAATVEAGYARPAASMAEWLEAHP